MPYYISDTEGCSYRDVAKSLHFENAKHSHKVTLETASFCKLLKDEITKYVVVAKYFKKKYIGGIGQVLYVKDEFNRNVAHCYKESGKMVLHVMGMG